MELQNPSLGAVLRTQMRNFLGGPMAKSSPSNAEDVSLIPGGGPKILHVAGHLSLHTATREAPSLQLDKAHML